VTLERLQTFRADTDEELQEGLNDILPFYFTNPMISVPNMLETMQNKPSSWALNHQRAADRDRYTCLVDDLDKVIAKTLIMVGREDPFCSVEAAKKAHVGIASVTMSHMKVLFGTNYFGSLPTETSQEFLDILKKHNIKDIDTAPLYQGSERALKELGATSSFTIHTKSPGFAKGSGTKASILAAAKQSFEDLGVKSVETYFVHSPDPDTPIEQTVDAMQLVYASGKYKHFGLSNFKPEDVRRAYDYAKSKGYVLPTVFQGNYNAFARHYDTTLFPLLRELNIAFYAYSPLAGGFFVKETQTLRTGGGQGRWDRSGPYGNIYPDRYVKPSLLEALSEWEAIASEARVSKAALAYRWVMYSSKLSVENGDGVIIGASRGSQLEETLRAIEDGPLDESIAKRVDNVWELVKDEAPVDMYHL
ncbi:MAG: hypothetical protein Q9161_007402, partial [Pseudevernia consocians]